MVDSNSARVNESANASSFPRFRFASDAERRAFGPAQHIRAVHPPSKSTGLRRGFVVWGEKMEWTDDKGREQHWRSTSSKVGGETELAADKFIENGKQRTVNNLYFSMQSFRRPNCRKTWNLSALGCAFVDVDYRKVERWKEADPCVVMTEILRSLDDEGVPPPSFAMDSGNGLHCVWLHNVIPPAALKRWNRVQEQLLEALKRYGADPNAKDAARVLRLSGSWNPAARHPGRGHVHLVWIQGREIAEPFRYDFDTLADDILPLTRAEIVVLRAERARRNASSKSNSRKGRKPAARRDSASYAETVLGDLDRLRLHRYSSGILPAGHRDAWLFVASMALSWVTPAPALEWEIVKLAQNVAGWQEREARSRMGSIIRRAQDSAAGKTIEYEGENVDPRYRMKAETIVRWLAITEDEMRTAELRVLLDSDARRERKAQNARDDRKSKGATSREEQRLTRLDIGRRAMWMHVKDGMTYAEIASELDVAKSTVTKAITEARKASSSTGGKHADANRNGPKTGTSKSTCSTMSVTLRSSRSLLADERHAPIPFKANPDFKRPAFLMRKVG